MNTPIVIAVLAALALLVIDAVLGVALAVRQGGWNAITAQKLPGVAENAVLPVLLGMGGAVLSQSLAATAAGGPTTTVIVGLLILLANRTRDDIGQKIGQLTAAKV